MDLIHTFIVNPDVDSIIFSYLEPNHILSVSELNKHYNLFLKPITDLINRIKKDFSLACQIGPLKIAQWIYGKQNFGVYNHFKHTFEIVCKYNRIDMAQWIIDKDKHRLSTKVVRKGFVMACENGHLEMVQQIVPIVVQKNNAIKLTKLMERAFANVCFYNHMHIAEWIIKFMESRDEKINIHILDNRSLNSLARNNNITMAKWLVSLGENGYGKFPLKLLFKESCTYGRLDMVQWVTGLKPLGYNIYDKLDVAFELACCGGHVEVADFILNLSLSDNLNLHLNSDTFYNACVGGVRMADWYAKLNTNENVMKNKINTLSIRSSVFKRLIQVLRIDMMQWLIELDLLSDQRINIHTDKEWAFVHCCKHNQINMAKYLLKIGEESYGRIDIHAKNEQPFLHCCDKGWLDMAKWLFELGEGSYGRINIHVKNEQAFVCACERGQLDIAKWLIEIGHVTNSPVKIRLTYRMFVGCANRSDDFMMEFLIDLYRQNPTCFDGEISDSLIELIVRFQTNKFGTKKVLQMLIGQSNT